VSSADTSKLLLYRLVMSRLHEGWFFSIGESKSKNVIAVLGTPDARGDGWLSYTGFSDVCQDTIKFRFTADVLEQIEWQWCPPD
jgi:hypothetical protein